jgi:hypothetical protein
MVIGKGSYIAAATCVTEDVPQDSLAIGRARQVTKEGWAKTKRESLAKQVEHRVLSVIGIYRELNAGSQCVGDANGGENASHVSSFPAHPNVVSLTIEPTAAVIAEATLIWFFPSNARFPVAIS